MRSDRLHPPLTSDRSSLLMPTPGTEGIPTCGISSGALPRWVCPAITSRDQRPGTKKCGHQGGKVLVPADEQIKRLNAARFQLDIMGVPGIIVARTDAEAASLIDSRADERDQPFLLGATAVGLPSYKLGYLALLKHLHDLGLDEITSHLLYAVEDADYTTTLAWFERVGLLAWLERETEEHKVTPGRTMDQFIDDASNRFLEAWEDEAGLATFGDAVAEVLESRAAAGETVDVAVEEWRAFAGQAPLSRARAKAQEIGVDIDWDCELTVTPEGYYQVQGGLAYAIARSLAVAPFSDLLWMETKTANLDDAREFAKAVHAQFPDKMLAYNLSPSFSWDTTGMSDEEMRQFPDELGKMGFVFNFITYGGHQIDGVASEEFTTGIQQDGMLALARLQRKIRLVDSPYRTPQTLVVPGSMAPWWPRPDARLRPRPWAGRRHSISTSCRPKCPPSCSRNGWRCGPSTTGWRGRCGSSFVRSGRARSCSSCGSSGSLANRWRTWSFLRFGIDWGIGSSWSATRTRSTRPCGRSV